MHETGTSHRWHVLGRVVLFILGCAVMLATAEPVAARVSGKWSAFLTSTFASIGAFALTALFVRWERLSLADVGVAINTRSVARLTVGFLVGLLLVALWAAFSAAVGPVRWARAPAGGSPGVMTALVTYVVLSCREELAFRGYPLRRLDRLFGLWAAQLFVAIVFAAEHKLGGPPWGQALLGPGVGSLLFGMAAIATRGLAVPIGVHAAWNFGQWALGLKGGPGLWQGVVKDGLQESAHRTRMISYLIVIGAATLAFWLWDRKSVLCTPSSRHAARCGAP
jgi:membrane protease YdiL (CAAX protease family)